MKATEQYFPVVLFIILCTDVVPTFESANENLKRRIQIKTIELIRLLVLLFAVHVQGGLNLESLNEFI